MKKARLSSILFAVVLLARKDTEDWVFRSRFRFSPWREWFQKDFRKLSYVERKKIAFESRHADNK
jgi:hypothetical protein